MYVIHAFDTHFRNESFLKNKASSATKAVNNAIYKGDRQHFTLETYCGIMSKTFNDMEKAGNVHALNEQQKITTFENGLKIIMQLVGPSWQRMNGRI